MMTRPRPAVKGLTVNGLVANDLDDDLTSAVDRVLMLAATAKVAAATDDDLLRALEAVELAARVADLVTT